VTSSRLQWGCCVDKKCTPVTCMDLPKGKTCGDCIHTSKCVEMFGHAKIDTYCDWFPRRFQMETLVSRESHRIVFPLDGMDLEEAKRWMRRLQGRVGYLKIGLELFLRDGWAAVRDAHAYGHHVMLDLKLHDIPATMEGAVRRAVEMEVDLLTVHASAGTEAMRRCVKATEGTKESIVAVTVLTSLDEHFMQFVFSPASGRLRCIPHVAERLTEAAMEAGVRHFVCSPNEASLVRHVCGDEATIITPGVRLAGGDNHDQKRVNTPGAAVKNGADLLVIGRAIRLADDPGAAIEAICADIEGVSDGGNPMIDLIG
jgi:orotidine-5'-phosphate decarboxylase